MNFSILTPNKDKVYFFLRLIFLKKLINKLNIKNIENIFLLTRDRNYKVLNLYQNYLFLIQNIEL